MSCQYITTIGEIAGTIGAIVRCRSIPLHTPAPYARSRRAVAGVGEQNEMTSKVAASHILKWYVDDYARRHPVGGQQQQPVPIGQPSTAPAVGSVVAVDNQGPIFLVDRRVVGEGNVAGNGRGGSPGVGAEPRARRPPRAARAASRGPSSSSPAASSAHAREWRTSGSIRAAPGRRTVEPLQAVGALALKP